MLAIVQISLAAAYLLMIYRFIHEFLFVLILVIERSCCNLSMELRLMAPILAPSSPHTLTHDDGLDCCIDLSKLVSSTSAMKYSNPRRSLALSLVGHSRVAALTAE